ncbi:MAG TPA: hypothetical protein DEA22_05310 [Blastocatellia bacterium]|nr:hypothetical protein [Blastocatellia bacterium]
MDVYHKVLVKLYELTGGKDSVDVDMVELLKREGFFPSLQSILQRMLDESWIAETSRTNTVRITHWGVAEARRTVADTPDKSIALSKDTNRLIAEMRDAAIIAEDFAATPSPDKFNNLEQKFSELSAIISRIKSNV